MKRLVAPLSAALLATRSVTATATAAGVLVAGTFPYFWNLSPIGWAVLLLGVSLGGRILDAADSRVVRYFAGPRTDF